MIQKILSRNFCVQRKILAHQAQLGLRNSQQFQLRIPQMKNDFITFPRTGTLADIADVCKQKLNMTEVKFFCNSNFQMPLQTPINPMLNRYFYLTCSQFYPLMIQGQNFDYGKDDQVIEGVQSIQLPAVDKRQIQRYIQRINKWYQYKTGFRIQQGVGKLKSKDVGDIFVQALIDPQPQQRNITELQKKWEDIYWQVQQLKKKKRQADELCLRKVKRRLSLGLIMIAGNIGFIWSGTYIIYSWDIIQPLAYFISSMSGIILASQYFKIGRPYSKHAYQSYLIDKYTPIVYKSVGFEIETLRSLQVQLLQLESHIKDHYLKRL